MSLVIEVEVIDETDDVWMLEALEDLDLFRENFLKEAPLGDAGVEDLRGEAGAVISPRDVVEDRARAFADARDDLVRSEPIAWG